VGSQAWAFLLPHAHGTCQPPYLPAAALVAPLAPFLGPLVAQVRVVFPDGEAPSEVMALKAAVK